MLSVYDRYVILVLTVFWGRCLVNFFLKLTGIRDSWQAYEIVDMTEFGIHECPPFPSNMMQWPHWEARAVAAVKNFFAFWRSRRRVLIYCRQGANRSAAMVCLVMSAACGRTAREALIARRPAHAEHKHGSPTVHAHLKNSNKLKTNSRRIQGKLRRTQDEITTNSRQTQDALTNNSRRIRGELETNSE